ncbi:MAG: prepilin-type N-terminal cleavage/methylation domain-containing protein [Actinomycetota bacterium]
MVRLRCRPGFTLIELLVALAIIALLLSIVTPRYFNTVGRAEEAVLKQNLVLLRDAIDKHFADTGKYPEALDDLVAKRYLRSVPVDPITQSAETWVIVPPADAQKGAVYDIRSGASGQGRDGRPYEKW